MIELVAIADVIVAMKYRRYLKFNGTWDQDYVEGIVFYISSWEQIINYPKPHSKNLTTNQSEGPLLFFVGRRSVWCDVRFFLRSWRRFCVPRIAKTNAISPVFQSDLLEKIEVHL